MRMGKGAIMLSMALIIVASVLVGMGTMAYFSSSKTVGITFAAGTPNLRLSLDGTSWGDSLSFSFPVWAPGDTCDITVWVKNNGDIGLGNLFVCGDNLGGPNPGLSDVINITHIAYTDTSAYGGGTWSGGYYWVHPAGGTYYNDKYGDNAEPFTLRELTNMAGLGQAMKFCWGLGPAVDGDYLPASSGMIQGFYIEFGFDNDAGNTWQGKSCSFDLVFIGTDSPFVPVWPLPP